MTHSRINLVGAYAYSSTGGIQAVNRFLITELAKVGMLRKAFLLWDDDATANPEGIEARRKGWVDFFGLRKFGFLFAVIAQAFRHPQDLWLCTHINYALLTFIAAGWRRKRVILFIYAAELDEGLTPLKLFALRRFTRIIAISNYTKKKALKLGVRPDCVRVMYIGVADPCPHWQQVARLNQAPRILFVGRMDERYKGQMELLDSTLLLRARFPDLRLIFVGGGKTLDDWKAEACSRGLEGAAEFLGRVSDERLAQEYENAAIFVMLSENEGFGLVYTEAMARGLVCIGGDRDAAQEVIAHGVTGYCVPAGNSTALADAIAGLLRAPETMTRMGLAGRQRFLDCFTATHYRQRLLREMEVWQGDFR